MIHGLWISWILIYPHCLCNLYDCEVNTIFGHVDLGRLFNQLIRVEFEESLEHSMWSVCRVFLYTYSIEF